MLVRFVRLVALLMLFPLASVARAAEVGATLDPTVGLNAYSALVDQEFGHARSALRVLAASENARSGDWERIKEPLAVLAKGSPTRAAVWFARSDGSYYAVDTGLTDQSLADRGYFPALMAGQEVACDLVVSKSTGKRSAIVAVPVWADGRVIGALGVSISMEKMAAFVDDAVGFPSQMTFFALDSHGQGALHRQSSLLFEFPTQLGSPTLTAAVTEMLAKPQGMVRYEFQGVQRTAVYRRSAETGWVYVLRW